MKLLFDQNISFRIIGLIKDTFPESKQIKDLNLQDQPDKFIWQYAKTHGYTIVTFDSDFYDHSLIWGHPPKIIWLRTFDQTTKNISTLLHLHSENISQFERDNDLTCLQISTLYSKP